MLQFVKDSQLQIRGEELWLEFEDHLADVRTGVVHQRHLVVGVEVLPLTGLEHLQPQLLLVDPGGLVDDCLVVECLADSHTPSQSQKTSSCLEKSRQPSHGNVGVEDVELAKPEVGEVGDAAVGDVARTLDVEQLKRVATGLTQNQDDLVRASSEEKKLQRDEIDGRQTSLGRSGRGGASWRKPRRPGSPSAEGPCTHSQGLGGGVPSSWFIDLNVICDDFYEDHLARLTRRSTLSTEGMASTYFMSV